jgi:1-acyl-sn-glycerol-3-phosphate acyltransferase
MRKDPLPKDYQPNPFIKILYWMKVWIHVISGAMILSCRFPFVNQETKDKLIQNWSKKLLLIFGIQLRISNPEILPSSPFLLVSNHISWMDIHAINAFKPIRFVAKSEVEGWPLFGWMAKQLGTVFIKRDNSRHGRQVATIVAKVLSTQSVCIFPEGTSTEGDSVLPFKANLFESAIISKVPVYSLALSYKSLITGLRSQSPAFVGEMGLLESMGNILNDRQLVVELCFLLPAEPALGIPRDRKFLAFHSHEAIKYQLNDNQPLM